MHYWPRYWVSIFDVIGNFLWKTICRSRPIYAQCNWSISSIHWKTGSKTPPTFCSPEWRRGLYLDDRTFEKLNPPFSGASSIQSTELPLDSLIDCLPKYSSFKECELHREKCCNLLRHWNTSHVNWRTFVTPFFVDVCHYCGICPHQRRTLYPPTWDSSWVSARLTAFSCSQ